MNTPPRPRRWPRRLLFALTVAALGVALALAWLLRSEGGRDAALARLLRALPEDSLSWSRAEGAVAGPLVLHDARYAQDGVVVTARRLELDLALLPALGRRLSFERLAADGLVVELPASDAPFRPPTWPESMPRVPIPFLLSADVLAIDGFELRETGTDAPLLSARRIDGEQVVMRDGGWTLGALLLDGSPGQATLAGEYLPDRNYRSDLRGGLVLPARDGEAEPSRLKFTARGDLDALAIELVGRTPERLNASLQLRDGRRVPAWTLEAFSEGLPAAWTGAADDDAPWRGRLSAEGLGGEAQVQGELAQGEWRVLITPSHIGLVENRLLLRPLEIELPEGPLRATGQVQYGEGPPAFDLQLASAGLRFEPQGDEPGALPVQARGELRVRGEPDAWTLAGDARLARDGEEAALQLAGEGTLEQVSLSRLEASMPTGTLAGTGRVSWSPALSLALDARLAGFDPGYFLPDYPGAVRGELALEGAQDADGRWTGQVALDALGGQLRGRTLGGRAQVRWALDRGEAEADLRLGDSQLRARGGFGARYDLALEFAPLALADLLAGGEGRLEGRLQLRGTPEALDVSGALSGEALAWDGQRADQLRLDGALPARGEGRLDLLAAGLTVGGMDFDSLGLQLQGNQSRARLRAAIAWPQGRADAAGALGRSGERWSGELDTLRLAVEGQPALALQAPTAFAFGGRGPATLERACLQAEGYEGQLCAQATGDRATLAADALPLALLQPWLPQDEGVPMHLSGRVDGQAQLQRGRDGTWRGGGRFDSPLGALRLDEDSDRVVFGYRDLGLDWRFDGEWLEADVTAALANDGRVEARLRTGLAGTDALTGELVLDVRELTWLELFSEDLASPTGRLQGRLGLAGTRAAPEFSGQARLADFAAELPALGLRLREGGFLVTGQPDGATRIEGSVRSGDGRLDFDGSLNFRDAQAPLQLVLRGTGVTLASTAEFYAIADPDLQLRLAEGVLQVRGRVDVGQARFDLEALDSEVATSPDVVVVDPVDPARERALPLDLDFSIALGEDVRLKGFGLDGRMAGTLALRQRPGRPATASGGLDVSGRYRAYGQALEITRGRLGFADSPVDNPSLDLRAEREFDEVTVGVQVRGTAQRPQTTVVSTPAMDTSEALSWLVFGRPLRSTSGSEAEQLDAAAMALGAGGNLVAQQIGARLGLDEAGITDSRNLGGATFTVGKYLSPRLFVSYGVALVGTGQVVTLKYLLRRGFDIRIESGNESAASLNWRTER